jgi:hypothetical protein
MKLKLCEAWARMQKLQTRYNLHHKIDQVLDFAQDGIKATNDKDNLKFACNHFKKVFNRELSYVPSIIDH